LCIERNSVSKPKEKLYKILRQHVPENAVHYCLDLWEAKPFHFKVTRKRNSKLGDYRFNPNDGSHSVTVNHDLNRYSFLITYIHEVAHLLTKERNTLKVKAHGPEWQANFRELMEPVLSELIFPKEVLVPLYSHMCKPKASTYSDAKLLAALRKYDDHRSSDLVPLEELEEGDIFEFNSRMFTKMKPKRTRVLCQQAGTSRKYLISKLAMVRNLR